MEAFLGLCLAPPLLRSDAKDSEKWKEIHIFPSRVPRAEKTGTNKEITGVTVIFAWQKKGEKPLSQHICAVLGL